MRFPGFIGPSYTLKSVNVDCQRCINLFPEIDEAGTGKEKEVAALLGTPGLNLLATIGTGPYRGAWTASNGQLFVVSGNTLYRVSSTYVPTTLGTLNTTSGQVSISDNGLNLVVVDGAYGYVWTFASSLFAQITAPAFLGADTVTFQDGYFIFNKPATGQFYISGLNAVTFNGLDIASSEGNPDNVVAVMSVKSDLWIFNEKTTEVFYDSGAAAFPFERIQGSFIEIGCAAKFSIAKINNSMFWLGRDDSGAGMVYQATGYHPQRISTTSIENAIQSYGTISDAIAYTYQQDGHFFYVLNFTGANTTWVYDTATQLWHERVYTNQGAFERHRANCHAYFNGKHIVGDYQNGNLYEMSSSAYSDNGSAITRRRVAPHLSNGLSRIFYDSIQVDMEAGTGLDGIGQGTDPQIMLRFSDDGGHSWSNEKWASFGKIGKRNQRAIWRRLGQSRDRVFEVTVTDPVKTVIIGAEIKFQQGTN